MDTEQQKKSMEQLRAGMMNFIGSDIDLLPFEGKSKNRVIVAMLAEEALKVSQIDKSKPCDIAICKPLFDSVKIVLEMNIKALGKENAAKHKDKMIQYMEIVERLNELSIELTDQNKKE